MRSTIAAATLLLATALTSCASGSATPAHAAAPVLAPVAVPAGMGRYRFSSVELDVTIPDARGPRTAADVSRVADTLATYPVTLLLDVDAGHHQHVHAGWVRPPRDGESVSARAALARALPHATVRLGSHPVVGIRWAATAPGRQAFPATFIGDLQSALSAAVPGRYTISISGRTVHVVWAAPGLTVAGRDRISGVLQQQTGAAHTAVTTDPLH